MGCVGRRRIIWYCFSTVYASVCFISFLEDSKWTSIYLLFYKIHFLLWLIALVLVYYAVVYAEKQTKVLITGSFVMWAFLTGMYLGKIEEKIAVHNDLMISTYKAEDFNDICVIIMYHWHAGLF